MSDLKRTAVSRTTLFRRETAGERKAAAAWLRGEKGLSAAAQRAAKELSASAVALMRREAGEQPSVISDMPPVSEKK
jgi:hypothetical protein